MVSLTNQLLLPSTLRMLQKVVIRTLSNKGRTLYTEICLLLVHNFSTLLVLELMKLLTTFGVGGLDLAVEGPSKAEIGCIDNKDSTCTVTYLPTLPGDYNILVRYNDKHIAGSPFTARITGEDLTHAANVPLLFTSFRFRIFQMSCVMK